MISNIYDNFTGQINVKDIVKNYAVELEKYEKAQEEYEERQFKIAVRDETLIWQLANSRKNFCGVGSRKIKLLLNKLAKTDNLAKAYRIALEAEDKNISAKAV